MIAALSPLFVVVYLAFLAERLLEIAIHRRNAKRLTARGARWLGADGFGWILLAQWLLFLGLLVEVPLAPWSGEAPWTWALLVVLALSQALRYWAVATLGERWAIRVVTVSDAPRIVGGPYRFFPHPNYVAVMVEAIVLPLAFGAYATLAVVVPLQIFSLWRRIKLEESALGAADAAFHRA